MIDKLKTIADKFIENNKDNPLELKKYTIIREILNRENAFMEMSIEYAYSILKDLKIEDENIKSVYEELI